MTLDTQTLSTADSFDGTDSSPVIDPAGVATDGQDDGASPEGAQNTEGQGNAASVDGNVQGKGNPAQAAAEAEAKAKAEAEEKDKLDRLDRLDRHPRFQEVIRQNREAKAALQELRRQNQQLMGWLNQRQQGGQRPQSFDAHLQALGEKLDSGEISLGQYNAAVSRLNDARMEEFKQSFQNELAEKAKVGELHQSFKTQNPDFDEVARSEEFRQAFKANPMHDALSAYYATKYARAQAETDKAVKEAVAKAIRETEERITRNNQAKRAAASLGAGPRGSGYDPDAMLQDTSRHGGRVAVGAARLRAMRQAGG